MPLTGSERLLIGSERSLIGSERLLIRSERPLIGSQRVPWTPAMDFQENDRGVGFLGLETWG